MSQIEGLEIVESKQRRKDPLPDFHVGDNVEVHVKIHEGDKERVQVFSGTVICIRRGRGLRATFTVRRIVSGEGVERVFPFHSPRIQQVKIKRRGKARRAKLFYLRKRVGKATKLRERRIEVPRSGEGAPEGEVMDAGATQLPAGTETAAGETSA